MPRKKKNQTDTGNRYNIGQIAELSETFSAPERATMLRWFADQGENTQCEIIQKQTNLIREKRGQGVPKSSELVLATLVLAAKILRREELALQAKERLDLSKSADVSRRRMDKFKVQRRSKRAPKEDKIRVEFYHLITELQEAGNSWSMIAAYLHRFHRFPITTAYLYNSYQKIKKEMEASNG